MNKHITNAVVLALMLFLSAELLAITAPEIFNDGKRAFNNGRWLECEEIFTRFLTTWPDHQFKSEALYYQTIASTRNFTQKANAQLEETAAIWSQSLASLSKDLPNRDLNELTVAIDFARTGKPANWQVMEKLTPGQLKHYLERSWHPDPSTRPVETLKWANDWLKKHTPGSLEPEVSGKISLLKSQALWQILLSPLSISPNSNILKVCESWPVHTALEKELRNGFANGSPEVKRKVALIGYHYDYFQTRGVIRPAADPVKSKWYTYLSERGLNLEEAWCPR